MHLILTYFDNFALLLLCMFKRILILLVFRTVCFIMQTCAVITFCFFIAALLGWNVPCSLLRIALGVTSIVAIGTSVIASVPTKRTSLTY